MELADNEFTSIQFIIDNFPKLDRLKLSNLSTIYRQKSYHQYW